MDPLEELKSCKATCQGATRLQLFFHRFTRLKLKILNEWKACSTQIHLAVSDSRSILSATCPSTKKSLESHEARISFSLKAASQNLQPSRCGYIKESCSSPLLIAATHMSRMPKIATEILDPSRSRRQTRLSYADIIYIYIYICIYLFICLSIYLVYKKYRKYIKQDQLSAIMVSNRLRDTP